MSDNFHIDISHSGDLRDAMRIAFSNAPGGKAEGYVEDPEKGLVFLWMVGDGRPGVKLPFKLDSDRAADFASYWLAEQQYPPEPDHDGDNSRGWRLYNEAWAKVGDYAYSIVAVKPVWMMHGK